MNNENARDDFENWQDEMAKKGRSDASVPELAWKACAALKDKRIVELEEELIALQQSISYSF